MYDLFDSFDEELLYGALIALAVVFILGHMLFVLLRPKRFRKAFSVERFRSARIALQKPGESSEEEDQECYELLDKIWNTYSHIEENDEGEETRKPKRMKEIVRATKILNQLADIQPTDEELVSVMNEHREVIHSNAKRSFDGSKYLIGMGFLVAVILALFTMIEGANFWRSFVTWGAFFWGPSIIYFISSMTPQFLIEKRGRRSGVNLASGCAGFAFGILGSGQTVRYKYSDGTTEDDNTGHVVAWVLGILAMFIAAITISFWALVNYLRNYVLYV